MKKQLELINKLRKELEELKDNFETAYTSYTNNIKEIEEEENNIKELDNTITDKEKKQFIIFIKKIAVYIFSMLIVGALAPPVVDKVICITMFTLTTMSALLAISIPKIDKKLYDLYLKLSPKSKQLEDEINKLEEELSLKREKKQQLELIKKELNSKLNEAELNMKNKETELREAEDIYFNNIFNTNNISENRTTPHKNTVKVRIKQKNNIQ